MDEKMIAEIAIEAPLDRTFYYLVPKGLSSVIRIGVKVSVPFGRRTAFGYVVGFPDSRAVKETADNLTLKEIKEICGSSPAFSAGMLGFYRWTADYYMAPLGEVIKAAMPPTGGKARTERFVTAVECRPTDVFLTPKEAEILSFILERGDGRKLSISDIREAFKNPYGILKRLSDKGMITVSEEIIGRMPSFQPSGSAPSIKLSVFQESAFSRICAAMDENRFSPFLLHGVTGSGKTEIYLRAIGEVLKRGKGAIVLVPEISLTPQILRRFRDRFGDRVAVLHSGLSEGERYDEWRRIESGAARIVIGARSAIFSPLADPGIIVVDEEHEHSYKQEESPRYNARDLAIVRGKQAGCVVVLGSATPSLESYYNARSGKYGYLRLDTRVEERPMPRITIVDMTAAEKRRILSGEMTEAIGECLSEKKQVLLFLNRRGFSTFLICSGCGYTFGCPNCSISLIYHRKKELLRCHYCDFSQKAVPLCPRCGGGEVGLLGCGTERVEDEIWKLFPEVRIARMDRDTVSRKGAHEEILSSLERGDIDILIGTQMITKGHDYPNIGLVGVISADTALSLPDFRAAESTFQLLIQVAGRAGRGSSPGRVIIQTFNPDHYSIRSVEGHDTESFFEREMLYRKELSYPPFSRLINIKLKGNSESETAESAARVAAIARNEVKYKKGIVVMGPSQSPLYKIRGKYRWNILLKGKDSGSLHSCARSILAGAGKSKGLNGIDIQVDVDPTSII